MQEKSDAIGADRARWSIRGAVVAVAGFGVMLGGCYHPEARIDPISPIAGNAIAHNKAVQTIDPWPDHAFRRHQVTDGERVRQAYESYRGTDGGGGGKSEEGGSGQEKSSAGSGDKPGE